MLISGVPISAMTRYYGGDFGPNNSGAIQTQFAPQQRRYWTGAVRSGDTIRRDDECLFVDRGHLGPQLVNIIAFVFSAVVG